MERKCQTVVERFLCVRINNREKMTDSGWDERSHESHRDNWDSPQPFHWLDRGIKLVTHHHTDCFQPPFCPVFAVFCLRSLQKLNWYSGRHGDVVHLFSTRSMLVLIKLANNRFLKENPASACQTCYECHAVIQKKLGANCCSILERE